jgi:ABC-type glycerol-3-phosphate transport system substrate-binding protein
MATPPSAHTTGSGLAITRRVALGAMVAGAAGFAVLGPRGRQDSPSGRIVLDYWEKWTRHEGDAMERIVRAFNESQSRIWVRYLVVSDIGQKSLVSIAGGNPPDLIGLYSLNVPAYAESGAILEYLVDTYGHLGKGDLAQLTPPTGTPAIDWASRWATRSK